VWLVTAGREAVVLRLLLESEPGPSGQGIIVSEQALGRVGLTAEQLMEWLKLYSRRRTFEHKREDGNIIVPWFSVRRVFLSGFYRAPVGVSFPIEGIVFQTGMNEWRLREMLTKFPEKWIAFDQRSDVVTKVWEHVTAVPGTKKITKDATRRRKKTRAIRALAEKLEEKADDAMFSKPGGILFDPNEIDLEIDRDEGMMASPRFQFEAFPAIDPAHLAGFRINILHISPANIPHLLGLP
jgi:hypothetical protein